MTTPSDDEASRLFDEVFEATLAGNELPAREHPREKRLREIHESRRRSSPFKTLTKEVAVHEAGHLVVGSLLQLDERGVVLHPVKEDELAQAYLKESPEDDKQKYVIRALSGLLAQLQICPEYFTDHLREACKHSVLFDPDHPHYSKITPAEWAILSTARGDFASANAIARQIDSENWGTIVKECEKEARALSSRASKAIALVADDILTYAEPHVGKSDHLFYPFARAKKIIDSVRAT